METIHRDRHKEGKEEGEGEEGEEEVRRDGARTKRSRYISFGLYLTMMAQNPRPFCQAVVKSVISVPRSGKPSVTRCTHSSRALGVSSDIRWKERRKRRKE